MSGKVKIDVEANVSNAKKALRGLENDLKKTSKTAERMSGKSGRGGFDGGGKIGASGGGLRGAFSEFASSKFQGLDKFGIADKLGGLSRFGGSIGRFGSAGAGYAGAVLAPLMAAYGFGKMGEKRAEQGKQHYQRELTLNQSLGQLSKNMGGSGFVGNLTNDLIDLGIKGKTPFEELTRTAQKLMLAFKGNQTEVKKWTKLIADLSAGTGESASFFTDLIVKAQQFGTVENESIKQLSEKGIPIYKTLGDILGVSAEQAKKIAEQGKITAQQFKKAAEEAVKISVAGSNENNVVKDAAYYEKQKAEIENELYSSTYTKEMEAMKARHAKARAEKAEEYYSDQNVQTMHEELARMTTGIIEVLEVFKDLFADFANWFGSISADLIAFATHHINDKQNIDAQNSINKLSSFVLGHEAGMAGNKVTLDELAYNMEDASSVAGLSARIEEIKKAISKTEKDIADSYVSEERRKAGQEVVDKAKEHLAILEKTLEKKQKDIELEKERERKAKKALELQTEALLSDSNKPEDILKAWNLNNKTRQFKNVEAAQDAYKSALESIRNGSGTEEDQNLTKHFKPMISTLENQKIGREEFELGNRAKDGDSSAKFQLEFNKTFKTMEKLGYSVEEIESFAQRQATNIKAQASSKLQELEPKQNDLLSSIADYETKLKLFWCGKDDRNNLITSYERGAWGQGIKMTQYDPAVITAKQQLYTMQEQSKRLQCQINLAKMELDAISKISLTPRAI